MTSWFAGNSRHEDSEAYGKHSHAHANLPVAVLLRRVVAHGDAIRLAWPEEGIGQVDECGQWPTGVLPRIEVRRRVSFSSEKDDHDQ